MIIANLTMALWVSAVVSPGAEKAAQRSSEAWLLLVDGARYDDSWDEAASLVKGTVSKEDWGASLASARLPLGRVGSRKILSRSFTETLPGAPDGHYVVIKYETTFQNKRNAVETIILMRDKDGTWRVSGYFIK